MVIEVPHIDFIFWDRLSLLEDCVQFSQVKDLNHLFIQAHTKTRSGNQETQCLTSTGKKISNKSSKSCEEHVDQETQWEAIQLTFDTSGHLPN